ncbi:MAG: hypothetical protein IJS80_00680 [Lachnospiraceae bacterium]|nr:hypothetical protein [Lachnospiraceae bacterium]
MNDESFIKGIMCIAAGAALIALSGHMRKDKPLIPPPKPVVSFENGGVGKATLRIFDLDNGKVEVV